jgi:hypothetical protein
LSFSPFSKHYIFQNNFKFPAIFQNYFEFPAIFKRFLNFPPFSKDFLNFPPLSKLNKDHIPALSGNDQELLLLVQPHHRVDVVVPADFAGLLPGLEIPQNNFSVPARTDKGLITELNKKIPNSTKSKDDLVTIDIERQK